MNGSLEQRLRDVLLRKSAPDLLELTDELDVATFHTLLNMQGTSNVISAAREAYVGNSEVADSLNQLEKVIDHIQHSTTELNLHVDLADVAGYRYHTGLKYDAFVGGRGRTVAKGGRYDCIGKEFGRARPATGFSADLKTLVKLGQ